MISQPTDLPLSFFLFSPHPPHVSFFFLPTPMRSLVHVVGTNRKALDFEVQSIRVK